MNRTFALLVLAAGLAAAQDRPGPGPHSNSFPWWDSPIVQDLKLSDEQQTQIRSTVRDYRSKLIELRAAMEKAEGELNDVYDEEKVDSRKAGEAIEHVVTARADLTRTFSQLSLKLRGVLTLDQWRELQKRRPRMDWRPGMPGMHEGGGRRSMGPQSTPPAKPPAPQN
jgi:Spy/CpxP family protein refolding chaperone